MNVLDRMLAQETSTIAARGDRDGYYTFPLATAFLDDPKDPVHYAPDKDFDRRLDTAWVEGRDASGIGQKIAFHIAEAATAIEVVNGLADSRWFSLNHRVRQARLTIR